MSISELRLLPTDEKLRIIETLWSDVTAQDEDLKVPDWHVDQLKDTEASYMAGREEALDWNDAKKELRAQFE